MTLSFPAGVHQGTEGLSAAIESLDMALAGRLSTMASLGCNVVITVVQELRDEPDSLGLHLTAAAIRWLAAAGASIDIDQYVID